MARAGNDQTYLLVFKNVVKARQFVASQELDGAEPRMVVRGNRDDIMRIARSAGVVGTLLDYDPTTQKYAATERAGVVSSRRSTITSSTSPRLAAFELIARAHFTRSIVKPL